jgi:hypothetical protein
MLGGDTMSKKKKKERRSAWSIDMLEKFRDLLVKRLDYPLICFNIKGRVIVTSLTNMSLKYRIHFLGESKEFEDVSFGLNPLDSSTEEYRDYLGYIDILNGESEPLMRGFIKKNMAFFESVSKMAIESKILNSKKLITVSIEIDVSGLSDLKDIPVENILNMKLPIKSISVAQQDSFV